MLMEREIKARGEELNEDKFLLPHFKTHTIKVKFQKKNYDIKAVWSYFLNNHFQVSTLKKLFLL